MKVMLKDISMELSLSESRDILLHSALTGGISDKKRNDSLYMLKNWQSLDRSLKLDWIALILYSVSELHPTERMAFLALVHDAIS